MYKVYICDDEIWICRSITKMLLSSQLPVKISYQFHNGVHAYEQIKAELPHILITDIRMPGFDGIELIQKVRELAGDIRIIVISGYDDFAYVQQALRYGAIDYLLKPIKRNELYESLSKAVANLEQQKMASSAETLVPELMQKLLLDIVRGNHEHLHKLAELLGVSNAQSCTAVVGEFMYNSDILTAEQVIKQLRAELVRQSAKGSILSFEKNRGNCGFVYIDSECTMKDANVFERVVKALPHPCQKNIAVAVGGCVSSLEALQDSYEEACSLLRQRALAQYGFIKEPVIGDHFMVDIKAKRSQLIAAIQLHDCNNLTLLTNEIVQELLDAQAITHRQACMVFTSTVSDVLEILYTTKGVPEELIDAGTRYCIYAENYMNIEQLFKRFLAYSLQVIEFLMHADELTGSGEIIGRIIQFINYHYQEPITLKLLSDGFHINACYLSTLFKQKTGSNFLDYLTKVRLEKAAFYLQDNTISISDIAALVGYDDVRYFSKQFKKMYGKVPTIYRLKPETM